MRHERSRTTASNEQIFVPFTEQRFSRLQERLRCGCIHCGSVLSAFIGREELHAREQVIITMVEDRRARLTALSQKAGRTENILELADPQEWMLQDFGGNHEEAENQRRSKRAKPTDPNAPKQRTALEIALQQAREDLASAGMSSSTADQTQQYKKINWDLKRDIQSKLDVLERRTQKAIVQLLREKLENDADSQELD